MHLVKISREVAIGLGFFLMMFGGVWAQQEANLLLYRYHLNGVNPAVVGLDGESWINGSLRKQWGNVPDAPTTSMLSLGVPMGKQLGLGFSFVQDEVFVEKQTGVFVDFSYHISMDQNSELYFGLKAGGTNYAITTSGLETYNNQMDQALTDTSVFSPNVGVGLYYVRNRFFVSLSAPRLFTPQNAGDSNGTATVVTQRPHFYAGSGYGFKLSSRFELEPSLWLQYVNGAPMDVNMMAMLSYLERISLGLSYRSEATVSGILAITLGKGLVLGYAYGNTYGGKLNGVGGSHEMVFRLLLGKRTKN